MRKVGIGIVGVGTISVQFLENFGTRYPLLNAIGVYDVFPEKARERAEQFQIPKVYAALDEMLADPEIEVIVNLTIPQAHYEINKACLLAGKHVYSEKPFAGSVEEGRELVELAREKGVFLASAPDTFMGSIWQSVRKALDDGMIGEPISVNAFWGSGGIENWHPAPHSVYSAGGGIILDIGVYALSQIVALLGPVARVACIAKNTYEKREIQSLPLRGSVFTPEVNTTYTCIMQLRNGVTVSLGVSYDTWFSHQPYMEIHGTHGSMRVLNSPHQYNGRAEVLRKESVQDDIRDLPVFAAADRYISEEMAQQYSVPIVVPYHSSGNVAENMRALGVNELAQAVAEGRAPKFSGDMALHILEVMLSLDRSAADGSFIEMTTTCEKPEPIAIGGLVK